ncbi:prolipoprotein diacylglyceryl transferase [Candidatus Riesia pediculicola]|uniref:prolipoprotein diacylglyceryl transferase n=1 Tax=Candidatus Riesia pediculicola TaxID=401619 RepID=UPI0009C39C51|nr:prolipoprotein diacylglyceryl transferase [Candidatus Riesia pediculicola]ARC54288.1 prolipoprotein diacylglyceryl transferase [Candidatus Riesia pediculicola]
MERYHYIKNNINPIAISFGKINIYWYGLIFFLIFVIFRLFLIKKISKNNQKIKISKIENLLNLIFFGACIGGRLGYIFFYNFSFFLSNPYCIFYIWKGGMSFHGGLVGVTVSIWIYSELTQKKFLEITDSIVTLIPIGIGLGRMGNFINGELWGKVTFDTPWAIIFPRSIRDDIDYVMRNPKLIPFFKEFSALPRHPSQIYEMFLEGFFLFLILNTLEKRNLPTGILSAIFLILYGTFRILVEIFRQPDYQTNPFYGWNIGQILSLPMIIFGLFIYLNVLKNR